MSTWALFIDLTVALFGFDTEGDCEAVKRRLIAAQSLRVSKIYCIELPAGVIPLTR